VVAHTPLHHATALEEELGGEIRLKLESLQRTGSFKIRGAYNFVAQMSGPESAKGIITYSSGNHAQAVALAAHLHGIRAVVVMPVTATDVKIKGSARLGAEVILEGVTSLDRKVMAESIAETEGLSIVPPFDHMDIIAGQGTVGIEIAEDWEDFDTVLLPIGGGGLCGGSAAALRRLKPEATILGVEPRGAASMLSALKNGEPVTIENVDSIADGLLPVRVGSHTFRHVQEFVDDVIVVSDQDIKEAAAFLFASQKLVVEYSGAVTVAALRGGHLDTRGRKTVAVISGGNIDPAIIASLE